MENLETEKERAAIFLARKHGVPEHKLEITGRWNIPETGTRLLLFNVMQEGHRKFKLTIAFNCDQDF